MTEPSSPPAAVTPAAARVWREALVKTSLLAGFTAAELDRLAILAHERRMRRGDVLMRRGDPGLFMLIVTQGEVRVQLTGESGQQQVLDTLGVGAVIGEIALFDGQARTADVVAATNGRVAVIERAEVLRLLAQDSQFALSVINVLCGRLRGALAQLESMVFQDVATRLAASLLRLAQGGPPRRVIAGLNPRFFAAVWLGRT